MNYSAIVLNDLGDSGFDITNWNLWAFKPGPGRSWTDAMPILVRHLRVGIYDPDTISALAALLARAEARPYWKQIATVYSEMPEEHGRDAVAGTLAAIAREEQLPDLEELFLKNPDCKSSTMFVDRLVRLNPDRWVPYFADQSDGRPFSVEAARVLKLRRNESHRP